MGRIVKTAWDIQCVRVVSGRAVTFPTMASFPITALRQDLWRWFNVGILFCWLDWLFFLSPPVTRPTIKRGNHVGRVAKQLKSITPQLSNVFYRTELTAVYVWISLFFADPPFFTSPQPTNSSVRGHKLLPWGPGFPQKGKNQNPFLSSYLFS